MKQSIKIKFIFYISTLVIISMGITTLVSSINFRNTLRDYVNTQMQQLVEATSINIDQWLEDKKQDVVNWCDRSRFKTAIEDSYLGRAARKSSHLALKFRKEKYQCYESLNIVNLKGEILASSDKNVIDNAYKFNVSGYNFFHEALMDKVYISSVIKSPVSNKNIFIISAPIKKAGAIIGAFLAFVDLNYFNQKFIQPIKITKSGYAYLVDKDGILLYHPNPKMINMNINSVASGKQITQKKNGYINYTWEGKEKTVYIKSNDELGWTLAAGANDEEIFAPVKKLRRMNYLITAAIILFALFSIIILYQKIILRPMGRLMSGIESFGKGNLNNKIQLKADDEFNELAKSFNQMTERLQNSMVSIAVLEEEQKRFENITQTSGEWIWEIDNNGNFLFSSDLCKDILGYDKEEILQLNYYELLDDYGKKVFKKLQEDCISQNSEIHNFENFKKHKNSESVILETNCLPMTNADGKVIGLRGVDRDITKRKTVEQNLKHAYAELKSTQKQLMQSEKMASIGLLAAGVAHEVNNPMGFIMSNVTILKKYIFILSQLLHQYEEVEKKLVEADPATAEPLIEGINQFREEKKTEFLLKDIPNLINETLNGVERIKKIVSDLKTFSHTDEREHKKSNVNDLISTALNIALNEIKHKADVITKFEELPEIYCYPQLISQMFLNLIINACQAMKQKGTITLTTHASDKNIIIQVADTGCGIPEEHLSRLYEPFFTTKDVGKGTGLGLSIVYNIIEKHDGTITVSSKMGEGTTFTITLPIS